MDRTQDGSGRPTRRLGPAAALTRGEAAGESYWRRPSRAIVEFNSDRAPLGVVEFVNKWLYYVADAA